MQKSLFFHLLLVPEVSSKASKPPVLSHPSFFLKVFTAFVVVEPSWVTIRMSGISRPVNHIDAELLADLRRELEIVFEIDSDLLAELQPDEATRYARRCEEHINRRSSGVEYFDQLADAAYEGRISWRRT